MRLGVTDTNREDKFVQYVQWIRSVDPSVEIVKLTAARNEGATISEIDGLLLTGGGDVHPKFYGMGASLVQTRGVDVRRDEFEFEIIERALDADLPVLGICRGMQVVNVALGGSLHVDLVSAGFRDHTRATTRETRHPVSVSPHSTLQVIAGGIGFEVNSYHHQAVHRLGKGLVPTAVSEDGVIEAAEWAVKDGMPFLVLVQWHPERAQKDFVSRNLATLFLREVQHSVKTRAII